MDDPKVRQPDITLAKSKSSTGSPTVTLDDGLRQDHRLFPHQTRSRLSPARSGAPRSSWWYHRAPRRQGGVEMGERHRPRGAGSPPLVGLRGRVLTAPPAVGANALVRDRETHRGHLLPAGRRARIDLVPSRCRHQHESRSHGRLRHEPGSGREARERGGLLAGRLGGGRGGVGDRTLSRERCLSPCSERCTRTSCTSITIEGSGIESVSEDPEGTQAYRSAPPAPATQSRRGTFSRRSAITEDDFTVRQMNYTETAERPQGRNHRRRASSQSGIGGAAIVELATARKDRSSSRSPTQEMDGHLRERFRPIPHSRSSPGIYRGVDEPVQTPTLWNLLVVNRGDGRRSSPIGCIQRRLRPPDPSSRTFRGSRGSSFPRTAADIGTACRSIRAPRRYYDEILGSRTRDSR